MICGRLVNRQKLPVRCGLMSHVGGIFFPGIITSHRLGGLHITDDPSDRQLSVSSCPISDQFWDETEKLLEIQASSYPDIAAAWGKAFKDKKEKR